MPRLATGRLDGGWKKGTESRLAEPRAKAGAGEKFTDISEDFTMPNYIVLGSFTEQGIRNINDSPKRTEAVAAMAKKVGATLKETYWTLGQYDFVALFEAPDDVAMTALGLSIGKLGNVRTQTLRAFTAADMKNILAKVA